MDVKAIKTAKNVKNRLFKMHFLTSSKNVRQIPKPFLERFFLVVFLLLKSILHGQMIEKIASEVRPKKGKKLQKVPFLKKHFLTTWPLG